MLAPSYYVIYFIPFIVCVLYYLLRIFVFIIISFPMIELCIYCFECTNDPISLCSIVPVISYPKVKKKKCRLSILKDNKGKSGIYKWTHIISGKCYVGSARDLSKRFKSYFSSCYLNREVQINNSIIYRSIIKYGYSCFSLDILDFCDLHSVIQKEQYYLDSLKPEYNLMKKAGSVLGFKHREASIKLIRAANIGGKDSNSAKKRLPKTVQLLNVWHLRIFRQTPSNYSLPLGVHQYMRGCITPMFQSAWLKTAFI